MLKDEKISFEDDKELQELAHSSERVKRTFLMLLSNIAVTVVLSPFISSAQFKSYFHITEKQFEFSEVERSNGVIQRYIIFHSFLPLSL